MEVKYEPQDTASINPTSVIVLVLRGYCSPFVYPQSQFAKEGLTLHDF